MATDTERTVPLAEHERLAMLTVRFLDAKRKWLDGRVGPDATRLLQEMNDHERRLRQVSEAALVAARRPAASLFSPVLGGES